MRIAICEDNREHAEILQNMVLRWSNQEKIKIEIGYYQSAEQFLFCIHDDAKYDLAFLDIKLEKMDGLQLAKRIRAEDKSIVLVFTTGEKDYALEGYEVAAFRYLMKPLREAEVMATLDKVYQLLDERHRDAVIVNCDDEVRRIYKNDIYYMEVENHHIVLHTRKETIRFKAKLKEFEVQFKEPQFCKCHRSYIVNLHYAGRISRDGVLIENGACIPISRNRWDDLNRCYVTYYTGK